MSDLTADEIVAELIEAFEAEEVEGRVGGNAGWPQRE